MIIKWKPPKSDYDKQRELILSLPRIKEKKPRKKKEEQNEESSSIDNRISSNSWM